MKFVFSMLTILFLLMVYGCSSWIKYEEETLKSLNPRQRYERECRIRSEGQYVNDLTYSDNLFLDRCVEQGAL